MFLAPLFFGSVVNYSIMVALAGFLLLLDLTPSGSGSGPSDVDQCVGRLTAKNVKKT